MIFQQTYTLTRVLKNKFHQAFYRRNTKLYFFLEDKINDFIPEKMNLRDLACIQLIFVIIFTELTKFAMGKNKVLYHILFWIFIFLWEFHYLIYVEPSYEIAVSYSFMQTIFGVIISYINLFILIPKLLKVHNRYVYILGTLISLALTFYLFKISGLSELIYDLNIDNNVDLDIYAIFYSYTLEFSLFTFLSFFYWYFSEHKREKEKALQFQNEKLKAELQLLKSQVSPHFLFNSLNNIYSLSVLKDENASIMIEKLSDILRYIIYEGRKKKVVLQREIELLENYIQLQLLRKLKNDKSIEYKITGDFSNKEIAPLLLINTIENCFKHSNVETNENGFLKINISVVDNNLNVHTQNTFASNKRKKGIGMKNLKGQLKYHYPNTHTLNVDNKNSVFDFKLKIELS